MVGVAPFAPTVQPAAAAGPPYATNADAAAADHTVTATDGTTLQVRMLYPTVTAPAAGWPLIVWKTGWGTNRCGDEDFMSRITLASYGYVVVSMQGRGMPDKSHAGSCTGGNQADDINDSINDSGADFWGPNDVQDIKDVITWAIGQSTIAVDSNNIGFLGHSYDAALAYQLAYRDSRIKAVFAGPGQALGLKGAENVSALTDHPTVPNIAQSFTANGDDIGVSPHTDPSFLSNLNENYRDTFLRKTIPSANANGSITSGSAALTITGTPTFAATDVGKPISVAGAGPLDSSSVRETLETTISAFTDSTHVTLATTALATVSSQKVTWGTLAWMNARTIVDDDSSVDKAHHISTPMFISAGYFDNIVSVENDIQAWQDLPAGNKFLYLGTCNWHGNACATNNATWLRNKVIAYFNHYLAASGLGLGGPIFFAVPPAGQFATNTDNWACDSTVSASCSPAIQTSTSWPPAQAAGSPVDLYLRAGGVLGAAPTTNEAADTITSPNQTAPTTDICKAAGYVAGEYATYTSAAWGANYKMVQVDANIYMSSTTDRMQVYLDLIDLNPANGSETSLWRGTNNVVIPSAYGQTAGTVVHFTFRPGAAGWTWPSGHKVELKVLSNFKAAFPVEPVPATYSIYHTTTNTEESKITLTLAS